MKCSKCGTVSDFKFCPNCGERLLFDNNELRSEKGECLEENNNSASEYRPDTTYGSYVFPNTTSNTINQSNNSSHKEPLKNSGASIVAFILSFFCCGGLIGAIIGAFDLLSAKKESVKHRHELSIVAIVIGVIMTLMSCHYMNKSSKNNTAETTVSVSEIVETVSEESSSESSETVVEVTDGTGFALVENNASIDWLDYYDQQGIEVIYIDANVLYDYGPYYVGRTVCTVITVSYKHSDYLDADTDNNDSLGSSISASFDIEDDIASINVGDTVAIVGEVGEATGMLNLTTVVIPSAHVVSVGDDAEELLQELIDQRDEQISCSEELQETAESIAAQEAMDEREAYISTCEQVNYNDVARNPDTYDGTNIVVSGSVIQVSEGWLDSVTLRVSSGGNVWLVDYWRDDGESRILEGDYVTIYGECTGVTTYLTTDLSTATVPSISAEIIDIN